MRMEIHPAQLAVLRYLRQHQSSRYSELAKTSGLDTELFRFHVQKLQKSGMAIKNIDGAYELTPAGKEFANNLDDSSHSVQKQPKLSVLVVLCKQLASGTTQYLLQCRQRNPYWGYWGFISGPVVWGESAITTAHRELLKQTALSAVLEQKSVVRKRDFNSSGGTLLEDKLFIIFTASGFDGSLSNDWPGGYNAWLSSDEIRHRPHFASEPAIIEMIQTGKPYADVDEFYAVDDY